MHGVWPTSTLQCRIEEYDRPYQTPTFVIKLPLPIVGEHFISLPHLLELNLRRSARLTR
jgi:hypothetical protein